MRGIDVRELEADAVMRQRDALAALLADAVEGGASVGYVLPHEAGAYRAFAEGIARDVRRGEKVAFAAFEGDRLAGLVLLAPCAKPNQPHRADVQKLLVHRAFRRRGIGRALMDALEARALASGRTLLTLDTRTGSDADALYRRWGWTTLGVLPGFAYDPDGTLAACTFHWKALAPHGPLR